MATSLGELGRRLGATSRLVTFQHTVFALPFAVIALVTAAGPAWPRLSTWLWVGAAMVSARTAAMACNRLADHEIDRLNPRTAERPLPAGELTRRWAWGVVGLSAMGFVVSAAMLNRMCAMLALPTLAVLLGYSWSKRFTPWTHLWLGAALGLAPVGAWLAVTARLAWPPVVLGLAVACWVAGFDILYALQDEEFDRRAGLFSVPQRFGASRALVVSRLLHGLAVVGFSVFAWAAGGGPLRWAAVAAAGALLVWQHRLVRPGDLSAVNRAFFTANGVLAVVMGVAFLFAKMRQIG